MFVIHLALLVTFCSYDNRVPAKERYLFAFFSSLYYAYIDFLKYSTRAVVLCSGCCSFWESRFQYYLYGLVG